MRKWSHRCDVAVIGAGLSGMMAAAAARARGASVALLADGHGALELSSGCIDLLGATPAGDPVVRPWRALAELETDHPYRLLGSDRVRAGLAAFQEISAQMGLPYSSAGAEENQWMATALGRLRPTYLRPPSARGLRPGGLLWVVGIRSMPEFHPGVVAEGLRHSLPETEILPVWVDLPPVNGQSLIHPLQVARHLDDQEGRAALVQGLLAHRPSPAAPRLILFPAVLGIDRTAEVQRALAEALGAQVAEVPLLTPSVPGLRLAAGLRRYLERVGVDLRMGLQVTSAQLSGDRVESLQAGSAGGTVEIRPCAVVLATGGLLGRGFETEGRTVREVVFGLPVESPLPGAWASEELLPAAGHGFVRSGIRTGSDLRPEGYSNLYVCGRALAGYDPYAEGSGGGVALATGWYAGERAGGAAR